MVPEPDAFTRFVIELKPAAPEGMTPALIRAHVDHLRQLDARGQLELCGPFVASGGMVILKGVDAEEARAIAEADPFVSSGVETYTVRQWQLSCAENDHLGFASAPTRRA